MKRAAWQKRPDQSFAELFEERLFCTGNMRI
jgi:hypothetical protein